MQAITYDHVQQMVINLPARKLPLAYRLLQHLANPTDDAPLSPQEFLRLPITERRQMMRQQADAMQAHYQRTDDERQTWQSGDFSDEG